MVTRRAQRASCGPLFPRLRFFLRQAFAALFRSFGITALAVATTGLALGVLATFAVIVANLSRVADRLGREVEMSAYLPAGANATEIEASAALVRAWPEIEAVRTLTSSAAMIEFRSSLGDDAVLLDGLPAEVLPPSLELQLSPGIWTGADIAALAARLMALPFVEDVRYGQQDLERVHAVLGFARGAALVLGIALCFATILIVSNTIRLTVYARRDEIEIMSLVGATDAFVRAPFVLEGAIQGLLGGLAAAAGLVALEEALRVGIQNGLAYAFGPIELDFVPLHFVGVLLVAGTGLGLVGSLLAVGRFLKD